VTDRDLDPAQEERVRRLLADARHTEPMPDDVVARLDAVLADLAEESAPSVTVVTSLDAARRRRGRGRALLVAAAAVTVLGVGTPALMNALDGMGVASNDSAATGGAPEAATGEKGARDSSQGDVEPGAAGDQFQEAPSPAAASPPAALSSQAFKAQVKKYAGDADARLRDGETQDYSTTSACAPQQAWGSGRLLPATYDGELGMLVYRAPRGDVQRVDLYLCGTRTPVRSVLIPMP
jgi:hypothetical protein